MFAVLSFLLSLSFSVLTKISASIIFFSRLFLSVVFAFFSSVSKSVQKKKKCTNNDICVNGKVVCFLVHPTRAKCC